MNVSDLSPEQIEVLKAQFGPLFAVSVGGRRFICRTITRTESALTGFSKADIVTPEIMDAIFRIAVIHPTYASDDDAIDAGTIAIVVSRVLEKSGLSDNEALQDRLDDARRRWTAYGEISSIICAAFPQYVPADLDDLLIDELMDLVVSAEATLILKGLASRGLMGTVAFAERDQEPVEQASADEEEALAAKLFEGAQKAAQEYLS